METEESSFTVRMLQRANLRRSSNNVCKSSVDLKRRLSILDAIEDKAIKSRRLVKGFNSTSPPYAGKPSRRYSTSPSDLDESVFPVSESESKELNLAMQRVEERRDRGAENNTSEVRSGSRLASFTNSFNETEDEFNKDLSMVSVTSSRRSGDYDSFKWRRPHYGGSYQVKAKSSHDERSILVEEILKPQLVKVTEGELESPRKIELDTRESRAPASAEVNEAKVKSEPKEEQQEPPNHDYTTSSMTSISRAIDELDREIRYLEFRREHYDKTRSDAYDQMNLLVNEREAKPPRRFLPASTNNPRSVRSLKNRHAAKESSNAAVVSTKNPYTGLRRILEDTVANKNHDNAKMTGENKQQQQQQQQAAWEDSESGYARMNIAMQESPAERVGVEASEFAKTDEENNNDVNLETMENAVPRFTKNPAHHGGNTKMQRCQKIVPNLESTRRSSKFDLTKKTSQTNMESTISSITTFATQMTSESMQESAKREHGNYENTIPSEVERFLEDALGDELNNTSVTYAQADGRDAMSQYNASEFISDGDSLGRKDLAAVAAAAAAAGAGARVFPKYYGTLDRTRTLYRSFTQRLKKKLHSRLKDRRYVISNPIVLPKRETEKMQTLLQELEIQQTLLYQASKALNLCYTMKNFTAGPEHVESERLLLLTDLKKKAISDEIKRIGSAKPAVDPSRERGEITIKDIVLPLNQNLLEIELMRPSDKMEWFVVTISHGSTVWASHAIPRHANDTKIDFPESVSVPNLSPEFKIVLRVYSLKLRVLPEESKTRSHHSSTSQWKNPCASVRKIWKRTQKPLSTKQRQILCTSVRNTSFSLVGQLELSLEDISLCSPWALSMVQANSALKGTIELNISCKLHVSITHAGFLTHGDEAGGYATWNRRWCVLEGHILKFWNYPQEQESKAPLGCIDLMHCVTHQVRMIDRQLCAKPRTLVIRTARPKSVKDHDSMLLECREACTVVRNLLSCDTVEELMEWTAKLNHVISLLHEWNAITTYDAIEISDL